MLTPELRIAVPLEAMRINIELLGIMARVTLELVIMS